MGRLALKRMVVVAASTIVWFAVFFAAAGRLDWTRAWICLAFYSLNLVINGIVIAWKNPTLFSTRGKQHKDTKTFDRVFAALYAALLLVTPLVAGLDAVRYGWSSLPFATLYAGVALHVLGMIPVAWAMAVNPYLETSVRIQSERGHRAVTTGPYRFIRHPMYVGVILQLAGMPLALGSLWAYVPTGMLVLLLIWRTGMEDRTLRNELAGYLEYAQRTRYRLLPGVW